MGVEGGTIQSPNSKPKLKVSSAFLRFTMLVKLGPLGTLEQADSFQSRHVNAQCNQCNQSRRNQLQLNRLLCDQQLMSMFVFQVCMQKLFATLAVTCNLYTAQYTTHHD